MTDTNTKLEGNRGVDRALFTFVLLLIGFGLVMVYSASAATVIRKGYLAGREVDSTAYFFKQVRYVALGLIVLLVATKIDYHFYQKLVYPILGIVSIAMLVPVGMNLVTKGASRWIRIGGLSIQPAEALKVAAILWLAYSLVKKREKIKTFSVGFLPHLLVPGILCLLCLLQRDLGTAVLIAVVTFVMLFVAGAKPIYLFLGSVATAPIVGLTVYLTPYRFQRMLIWQDPWADRYGAGQQLCESLYGFAFGGLTGVGIGEGRQGAYLPESYNDFIAAIIGEELGVVGVWAMMIVFAAVVTRGIQIGIRARDEFGTYLAVGIASLLGAQVLLNISVAIGLLPTKGLNLPFVSYGGSALLVSMFSIGVLLNISKRLPAPDSVGTQEMRKGNLKRSQAFAGQEAG